VSRTISNEYSGSVTATGSVSVSFVVAQINAQLGITVGLDHTSSVTVSTSIPVPAGDTGIVQQAEMVNTTSGYYGDYEGGSIVNDTQLCPLANEVSVNTSIAETNYTGYESTGTASSSSPPWPTVAAA
jgi:hypothetical protein